MIKLISFVILWSLLLRTIKSHTTEVCNAVSSDGRTVNIYAATYHGISEINQYPQLGLLLTAPNGITTEYRFDSWVPNGANNKPPYVTTLT